jgi:hypothetical protein
MIRYFSCNNARPTTTSEAGPCLQTGDCAIGKMKELQSQKIRELKNTLVALGFGTLDEQASVLGLRRSSAWSVLKGNHKGSGLSAGTIRCLLQAPQLPAAARAKILEYVEEKASGAYGHNKPQLRRFIAQLPPALMGRTQIEKMAWLEAKLADSNAKIAAYPANHPGK